MFGARERTFEWAMTIFDDGCIPLRGWAAAADACRVSEMVSRGVTAAMAPPARRVSCCDSRGGRDRQRGTGRLSPAPSPGSAPRWGAAPPAGGSCRTGAGWRPTRRGPSGTPTPGAVSWSPLPLPFSRRTLQPPRVPRRAGRRERAPAPVRLCGMFVLAAGRWLGDPRVRGRRLSAGGCHGDGGVRFCSPALLAVRRRGQKNSAQKFGQNFPRKSGKRAKNVTKLLNWPNTRL